ncbi:MAG: rhomboid family intramembrane serine protease [Gemmatimonadota bacterium]|nr:rhomboid family intramembrane serine protease [Gemmatimonadota bacterium]
MTVLAIGGTGAVWWLVQGAGISETALVASICRYGVIAVELTGGEPGADAGPCTLGGLTWQAVFTSIFMHGGWAHLIGNMWFLWIFGNNVEDALGHVRFVIFYLVAGVVAAGAQIVATPESQAPMVGASGAVSAVMGAYVLLYPRARVDTLFVFFVFVRLLPLPAWVMLGYWIGLQLLASTLAPADGGGVAYMAHIGGFGAGLVLVTLLMPPRRSRRGRRPRKRGGRLR